LHGRRTTISKDTFTGLETKGKLSRDIIAKQLASAYYYIFFLQQNIKDLQQQRQRNGKKKSEAEKAKLSLLSFSLSLSLAL
jgi:hypothetical protein